MVLRLTEELPRRYLLHILLLGFMRVRHYGFLANRCRVKRLTTIRTDLETPPPTPEPDPDRQTFEYPCPECHSLRGCT